MVPPDHLWPDHLCGDIATDHITLSMYDCITALTSLLSLSILNYYESPTYAHIYVYTISYMPNYSPMAT